MNHFITFCTALVLTAGCQTSSPTVEPLRSRTVVTTDGEVDDYDSFIRLLL